jgi:hypothetical protein
LFGSVDDDPNSKKTVDEMVREAILEVENENGDKDKKMKSLTATKAAKE